MNNQYLSDLSRRPLQHYGITALCEALTFDAVALARAPSRRVNKQGSSEIPGSHRQFLANVKTIAMEVQGGLDPWIGNQKKLTTAVFHEEMKRNRWKIILFVDKLRTWTNLKFLYFCNPGFFMKDAVKNAYYKQEWKHQRLYVVYSSSESESESASCNHTTTGSASPRRVARVSSSTASRVYSDLPSSAHSMIVSSSRASSS